MVGRGGHVALTPRRSPVGHPYNWVVSQAAGDRMSTTTLPAVAAHSADGGSTTPTPGCRRPSSSRPGRRCARAPRVSILNHRLARELGLDLGALSPEAAAALFAGQDLPAGSRPIAQAYAGHQFGGFTMLGDGRAILLGEHRTPSGRLVDIQLKGAGRTRFSRGGDGRAALGPMLREYIISEAMAALGIPTTRSLAVVTTGEPVYRESVAAGGDPDPRGRQPHPRRDVRVRGGPPGRADPAGAGRLRDRPPLPGTGRRPAKVPGVLPRGRRTARPR